MKNLSKETVQKLKMIKACILAEPELYNQHASPFMTGDCGSPCCLAGWALWVSNPDPKAYEREATRKIGVDTLQACLDITENQAMLLFEA